MTEGMEETPRAPAYHLGRVANQRPIATIKTGRVAQPITDAF